MNFGMQFSSSLAELTAPTQVGTTGLLVLLISLAIIVGLVISGLGTLLGWIATARIIRSGGSLYGLRLALFAGLFLPTLVLAAIAFGLLGIGASFASEAVFQVPPGHTTGPGVFAGLLGALAVIIVTTILALRYARRVTRPGLPKPAEPAAPAPTPAITILPPAAIPTPPAGDQTALGMVELPAPPASQPKLSPTALLGALCGAAIMLAAPLAIVASQNIDPRYYFDKQTGAFHQGPTWAIVLMIVGWVLCGLSVAGMTLLGAVAVAQIRRTPEKLYGLRLALFDALLFPLLLLDLMFGILGAFLFVPSSHAPQHLSLSSETPPDTGSVESTVLGVLICALVGGLLDPLIYLWAWKKLRIERPRRDNHPMATESLATPTVQPDQPSAIAPTTREPK